MQTTTDHGILTDVSVATDVFDEAMWAPREPLCSDWRAVPAVYLHFYVGALPEYEALTTSTRRGTWPIYVGSTTDLRDRMGRYRKKLESTANLDTDDVLVAAIACASLAHARFAEQLLLDVLGTAVWNQPWLAGYGSQPQGANRNCRPSPWRTLHPLGHGPPPRPPERSALAARVAAYLAGEGTPLAAWPEIPPARALTLGT